MLSRLGLVRLFRRAAKSGVLRSIAWIGSHGPLLVLCLGACAGDTGTESTALRGDGANDANEAVEREISCPGPLPGAETLELNGRLIALGEFHGTREAPALAAEMLCAAARFESPLVLGVELSADRQALVDRFLTTADDAEARAMLLTSEELDREYQDGRTSTAMFQLLLEARRLGQVRSAAGRRTTILAFDHQLPQPEREIAMAKTVREARSANPDATMILLTGNLHAAQRRGSPFDPEFLSMAYRLSEPKAIDPETTAEAVDLVSLRIEVASGEAWYCNDSNPANCGPKPTGSRDHGDAAFLRLDSDLAGEGFDGLIYFPTSAASPPAISAD